MYRYFEEGKATPIFFIYINQQSVELEHHHDWPFDSSPLSPLDRSIEILVVLWKEETIRKALRLCRFVLGKVSLVKARLGYCITLLSVYDPFLKPLYVGLRTLLFFQLILNYLAIKAQIVSACLSRKRLLALSWFMSSRTSHTRQPAARSWPLIVLSALSRRRHLHFIPPPAHLLPHILRLRSPATTYPNGEL